ncbi:MAG: hypothetical protein WA485_26010, partial [Candidatus Sulfotelmatobacter sp.]
VGGRTSLGESGTSALPLASDLLEFIPKWPKARKRETETKKLRSPGEAAVADQANSVCEQGKVRIAVIELTDACDPEKFARLAERVPACLDHAAEKFLNSN